MKAVVLNCSLKSGGTASNTQMLADEAGHDWSISTGRAMAQNLVRVAEALATTPLEAPPQ